MDLQKYNEPKTILCIDVSTVYLSAEVICFLFVIDTNAKKELITRIMLHSEGLYFIIWRHEWSYDDTNAKKEIITSIMLYSKGLYHIIRRHEWS